MKIKIWIPDTFLKYFSKHFRDVGFTILWDFAGYERWKKREDKAYKKVTCIRLRYIPIIYII